MVNFKFLSRLIAVAITATIYCPTVAMGQDPGWQRMLGDLPKNEKAGQFGLCGICVDRNTGDVFINLSDRGFYRSTDRAKTFKRISDTQPKGRTKEGGCFLLDPTGKTKKMVTALVYGSPISVSDDGGATWKMMHAKSSHVDWCAVDWTDPEMRFVLALKHEAGGLLMASNDGGKSFRDVGKQFGTGWVFDNQTAVVAQARTKDRPKPNLVRTTDGGMTWKPCGAYSPVGVNSGQALPRWHDGVLYWLVEGQIITTADKGETWQKLADVKDGRFGPAFGKSARHLFVLTGAGIVETTDAGAMWSKAIPIPKGLKGITSLTWMDYDPTSDSLYLMRMTSDLYKLSRGTK